MNLTPQLRAAIEAHAINAYPKEACGLIVAGEYRPCFNYAVDPTTTFHIAPEDLIAAGEDLEAIVHSHPDGPDHPSEEDMRSQMTTDVPWIIAPVYEGGVPKLVMWGDSLPSAPLLGRVFLHGVADCYALIRDVFRLGREECAKQDVSWPFEPIKLPDYARRDGWWSPRAGQTPDNHYLDLFDDAGFFEISREQAAPGDIFLKKIRAEVPNHGGVLLEGGLVLHHLPNRLSRREPASVWANTADVWLRHKSNA